jgi:ribonuclease HI
MTIVAAADGSALGNPGPAGWAWYVDEERWAAGGWPHGTNNQGELMAVLDLLNATAGHADEELHVLCDSQYVINAVTKWMPGWKRKGWRKADGSPVLNLELLKQLDAALAGRRYSFEWVKGHAGHDLNEAADLRARAVAIAYQNGSPIPTGPGWPGRETPQAPSIDTTATASEPAGSPAPLFELDEPTTHETDTATVERLEQRLLDPAVRSDAAEVAALLHHRFEEIGTSGRLWDRETTIQSMETSTDPAVNVEILSTDVIADGVVLVVYRTVTRGAAQLRSSLWLLVDGRWRLRFHQGTAESIAG